MKNLIILTSFIFVIGFFLLGKFETKTKALSIYDLAYAAKSSEETYNPRVNSENKAKMQKLVNSWKEFNHELKTMSLEKTLTSLHTLDSDHRWLLRKSDELNYPLDLLELTPPRLRFVVANRVGKKIGELNLYDLLKLEKDPKLWREITLEANNLQFVASISHEEAN